MKGVISQKIFKRLLLIGLSLVVGTVSVSIPVSAKSIHTTNTTVVGSTPNGTKITYAQANAETQKILEAQKHAYTTTHLIKSATSSDFSVDQYSTEVNKRGDLTNSQKASLINRAKKINGKIVSSVTTSYYVKYDNYGVALPVTKSDLKKSTNSDVSPDDTQFNSNTSQYDEWDVSIFAVVRDPASNTPTSTFQASVDFHFNSVSFYSPNYPGYLGIVWAGNEALQSSYSYSEFVIGNDLDPIANQLYTVAPNNSVVYNLHPGYDLDGIEILPNDHFVIATVIGVLLSYGATGNKMETRLLEKSKELFLETKSTPRLFLET